MTRARLYLLLIALAPWGAALTGQTATLYGTIKDARNEEALIGANISAGQTGGYSGVDGRFEIHLQPGAYYLRVSYVGYHIWTDSLALAAGEKRELSINLSPGTSVLGTATVTTGRHSKALGEVTVSLEILQPSLISHTNKTNLSDALEKVPGVRVIDGQANIRGGSGFSQGAGSRVLLLLDDIPILQADAGFPNWIDVPVELIDQVEVVKGASSSLYGSSAMNGIINVRTAMPTLEPQTRASVFYTHYFGPERETLKWWDHAPFKTGAQLSHTQRFKRFDLAVGGFYLNEESFQKDVVDKYGRVAFNTRYRLSDRFTIGLNGNINTGTRKSYFYWAGYDDLYVGSGNTVSKNDFTRFSLDPHLTYFDKSGNRHRFLSRIFKVDNNITAGRANESLQYYAEYQFQRTFRPIDLVLTAGIVATGSKVEAILYGDTTFIQRNYAGYVQLDKKIFDRLNLSAGFRFEDNMLDNPGFRLGSSVIEPSREHESKPVLRLGANYQLFEHTYLRASYGQAYRFPTLAEKYIYTDVGGFVVEPSPFLESETGWSTEIGLKQGFQLAGFEGYVDFAAFLFQYQDMMEFNLVYSLFDQKKAAFRATNIGGTSTNGFEISLAGRGELMGIPTTLLAGYTYIDPTFDEFDPDFEGLPESQGEINASNSSSDRNILKYRSQHTFKGDLESRFGAISAGLEVFYASHMEAIDRVFNVVVPGMQHFRQVNDHGFWLFNLRAAWQSSDWLRLSLLLNNTFNVEYANRPGLLDAPRNLSLRMDFTL